MGHAHAILYSASFTHGGQTRGSAPTILRLATLHHFLYGLTDTIWIIFTILI